MTAIRTKDGRTVGVGDAVWTANHWPWIVVGLSESPEWTWVHLEHQETEFDEMRMALPDTELYLYKSHPPDDCHRAGCQYRPWGAR